MITANLNAYYISSRPWGLDSLGEASVLIINFTPSEMVEVLKEKLSTSKGICCCTLLQSLDGIYFEMNTDDIPAIKGVEGIYDMWHMVNDLEIENQSRPKNGVKPFGLTPTPTHP